MTKRILSIFTILVMVISLVGVLSSVTVCGETDANTTLTPTVVQRPTPPTSMTTKKKTGKYITGKCGKNVKWYYSESTKNLTVSGKGVIDSAPGNINFRSSIKTVAIEDGITSIGDHVFTGSVFDDEEFKNLASITIPKSIISISSDFGGCVNLKEINVDSNNTKYSSQDGILFNKSKTKLIKYPAGKTQITYTIPKSVESIENDAFSHCKNLKRVIIPKSVKIIGGAAFSDCKNLKSVIIPKSVKIIGGSAFSSCKKLKSITIPKSVKSIGYFAFSGCKQITKVKVSSKKTKIGLGAFSDTKWYKKLLKSYKKATIKNLSVRSKSKKQILVTWSKVNLKNKKYKGYYVLYDLQISENKNFNSLIWSRTQKVGGTKVEVKGNLMHNECISGGGGPDVVQSGKTYYVRMRVSGDRKWSKIKSVKVK